MYSMFCTLSQCLGRHHKCTTDNDDDDDHSVRSVISIFHFCMSHRIHTQEIKKRTNERKKSRRRRKGQVCNTNHGHNLRLLHNQNNVHYLRFCVIVLLSLTIALALIRSTTFAHLSHHDRQHLQVSPIYNFAHADHSKRKKIKEKIKKTHSKTFTQTHTHIRCV